MKLTKYFYIGAVVASLSSCVSEDLNTALESKESKGYMALDVTLLEPRSTRAVTPVTDFPVVVYDKDGKVVNSYNKVSDVPATVVYNVGEYTVESHTPGELGEGTATQYPYFYGTETMEITKGITTDVEVLCKRKNGSVQVVYDEAFTNFYDTWTITVDDNAGVAPVFPDSKREDPNFVYWNFRDKLSSLTVNFKGKTKDGTNISSRQDIKKSNPKEVQLSYDDDSEYFHGGDCIVLEFKLKMDGHGTVTGVEITATTSLFGEQTSNQETIFVTDSEDSFEDVDDGGNDDPQQPENNSIQLTIPAPVTLSAAESATADPSSGDVAMTAEKGLKSVMVKVDSSSDEMMEQLAAVAEEYPAVTLVDGCEVVGNQGLVDFLSSLGKTITVPAEGDTEYTFPVGQFYLFLGILPGTHNFIMTVTDMEGNKKSGTVVVTITE